MIRNFLCLFIFCMLSITLHAKLPDLTPEATREKFDEIMKAHATYKELSPLLVKRILTNYVEELDPNKSYFIESDVHQWLEPSDQLVDKVLQDYKNNQFDTFKQIQEAMVKAIQRRHELEKQIHYDELPKHVSSEEFKEMKWTTNEQDLLNRIIRIKGLQVETASKLNEELKEKSLQRIAKRQARYEEEELTSDPVQSQHLILSNFLKAAAASLDAHTAYFTPDEAAQFLINVQQRLFGIGAQLRDDINGFTVIKVIEGGPAANSKELKVKDRIIAVNGEPVVGMDIVDAVELIRGEENTPVTLTVIREVPVEGDKKKEEKLDITIKRGEVVLKETRYSSSYEPFGNGIIGYLRLYSFYQDPETSSASDLAEAINKMKEEHKLKGLILDLRYNSGGMLSQAVAVTGLFISKGTVVSIKDDKGSIQHLRNLEGKATWEGPLIVLINRASASASEIVAGTLQDYGRAIIIGDDHSYGKGSFQTFTLSNPKSGAVNPEGEYKVTRGRYYTVSGRTPQLTGVLSDIVIPGSLSETEIGEKFAKNPLENDQIKPNFDDDLADIPYSQRSKVRLIYKFDLQPKLTTYAPYLALLKQNSSYRIEHNKNYQNFLKEIKKKDREIEEENEDQFGQNDLQLSEANNVMKDLILLQQ
jgi:carboxyl-terminal processing protease